MQELPITELPRAYPWPETGRWVRAMMVHSLDGAYAGADGKSGSISSPTDRAVLAEARRLADAIVIGANTMRVERYRPMTAKPEHAQERAALGLASAPVLVLVSGALDLPWDEPVFSESALTPIVITTTASDASARAEAERHADLVVVDGLHVTPAQVLDVLERRSLRRIVCEGGPNLLRQFLEAGVVDELDYTIAPMIIGREQEPHRPPAPTPIEFEPVTMMTDEGFVFMRYVRPGTADSQP